MQTPVFFFVGPVGHGKTTAREIVSKITHLSGASCSDVIYRFLAIRRGVSVESLRALPKEDLRPALIEAGDYLCGQIGELKEVAVDSRIEKDVWRIPSALIRLLYLNGHNSIDGVRRRLELTHAIQHLEWNGVPSIVIHVSDPRKPIIKDNSEDLSDLAELKIVNDGTVEDLEAKLRAFIEKRFGPQEDPSVPPARIDQRDTITPDGITLPDGQNVPLAQPASSQ